MTSWHGLRESSLLLEDEAMLALNKPAGLSVMGERHAADLVELAAAEGEELFPVHRIDKVTSGLILLAKRLEFHGDLTRQFNKHTVHKTYLMITESAGLPDEGRIDLPLSTGRKGRVRIAAPRESIVADYDKGLFSVRDEDVLNTRLYPSVTEFTTLWSDGRYTVLAVRPVTGRRHQIRVHLAWIGHAVVGDPLFDKSGRYERACLHSWRLAFDAAWRDGERMRLEATPGPDFWSAVADHLSDVERARVLSQPG